MSRVEYSSAIRGLPGKHACGDNVVVREYGNTLFMGIIDAAGHGEEAADIAATCQDFLGRNCREDLVRIINELHQHIHGPRGVVVGLCRLDSQTGWLAYSVMGNITLRIFGQKGTSVVPRGGVVGNVISTPRHEELKLSPGNVMVLHTDGIEEHFRLKDYPELLDEDARTIASHMIEHFGKPQDDAACIVLRYVRNAGRSLTEGR